MHETFKRSMVNLERDQKSKMYMNLIDISECNAK